MSVLHVMSTVLAGSCNAKVILTGNFSVSSAGPLKRPL